MRQKVILFLMLLLGASNSASSLDIKKSGASLFEFEETSDILPNVATIADMVFEKPNEAFLPDESEMISYEIVSLDDKNSEEDSFKNVLDAPKIIAKIEEKIETPEPISVKKEYVSSLLPSDIVKPEPKKTLAKVKKDESKFAGVKVAEGEEVLISTSSKVEKSSPKKTVAKTIAKIDTPKVEEKVEKTVAKLEPISKPVVETKVEDDNDNPFGVIVSKTKNKKKSVKTDFDVVNASPFIKAFSALKPESSLDDSSDKTVVSKSSKHSKKKSVASSEILKKDLHRAYLSGNQYLSAYEDEDVEDVNEEELEDSEDEEIEENEEENEEEYQDDEGFKEQKDVEDALEGKGDKKVPVEKVNIKEVKEKLSSTKKSLNPPSGPLKAGTREVLNMKIDFQEGSSAVSGESVNLIRSFAQIATEQPTNSIEITIPESVMNNPKKKKLIARRLSIVSNILRNAGISDRQILPVLSNRDENSFVFRVVSNDAYSKLRISKGTDIFGEEENVKEYNIMKW